MAYSLSEEIAYMKGLKMACKLWVTGKMTDTLLECLEARIAHLAALQGRFGNDLENHDCHLSPDDGCDACERVWNTKNNRCRLCCNSGEKLDGKGRCKFCIKRETLRAMDEVYGYDAMPSEDYKLGGMIEEFDIKFFIEREKSL